MSGTLLTLLSCLLLPAQAEPKKADPPGKTAVKEPALREELVKRMKAEQDVRKEVALLNPANKPLTPVDFQRPEMKAVMEKMAQIDKDNLAWLKEVVQKHGWPSRSAVGPEGAQAAFLIAQHAVSDLDFMAQCLESLKTLHKAGEAEGQWVALMTDRLLIMKDKKKQRYGTQLMFKDGKMVPQPIEDEETVDQRRKELGMPSLADYLNLVNSRQKMPAKPIQQSKDK